MGQFSCKSKAWNKQPKINKKKRFEIQWTNDYESITILHNRIIRRVYRTALFVIQCRTMKSFLLISQLI